MRSRRTTSFPNFSAFVSFSVVSTQSNQSKMSTTEQLLIHLTHVMLEAFKSVGGVSD